MTGTQTFATVLAFALFLLSAAMQMGDYKNPTLALLAGLLGVGLLIVPAWPYLRRWRLLVSRVAPGGVAASLAPVPAKLEGMREVFRDDFDIVAAGISVHGVKTEDGTDIHAVIRLRNRSQGGRTLKAVSLRFVVGGKPPEGSASPGISTPIAKETTQSVVFRPVRIYGEGLPIAGTASITVKFGKDNAPQSAVEIKYNFDILSLPKAKAQREKLTIRAAPSVRYFVAAAS